VLVLQSFYQVSVHSTVCRQLSVVCAFSEVMASTGRAGPGRTGLSIHRAGPGRYFNGLNGLGRIGPRFYRAGPGRQFSARAEY